jgi:hypothetical protein
MFTRRFVISIPILAGVLLAQAQKTQALLMALGANSKQVVAYQWKQRTTVNRNGNAIGIKIDEVRFDPSGQPQRITLVQPEQKKMGPLRAHKAAEIKSDIQQVMQLAASYTNPQELSQAIRKGEVWEGQGSLRVHARALILPMDEMEMIVNGATYLPARIEIKTQHEGSPITITADYQQLSNGPNMLMRMTVQVPAERIVVGVESFDFARLAGGTGF